MPFSSNITYPDAQTLLAGNPRVLMFAPGFVPHMASENIVNGKLALAMTAAGWDLTVISRADTGFAYGNDWQGPFASLQDITHEIDYPRGSTLSRAKHLITESFRQGHPIDGLRWASHAANHAANLHREQPFDLILSRSPMAGGHLPALQLAKQANLPWVANWNDPPEGCWPAPYPNPVGPINHYRYRRYHRAVMQAASVNTFPSQRLRDHVIKSLAPDANINTDIVEHVGLINHQPATPNNDGHFKLCHAGNLTAERSPETFFEGVARFAARSGIGDKLRIEILGVEDVDLNRLAGFYGLADHLTFTGPVPYQQALEKLAHNDVLVLIEADCKEGIFLPSKLVDYTQVGRPILAIAPRQGAAADLLARGGGIAVGTTDAWAVSEALGRLHQAWKHDRLQAGYDSSWLYESYSPRAVMAAYRRILGPILSTQSTSQQHAAAA